MRKVLKLAAYVTVLSLATIVVFAGPCEDGCTYNNTQCNTQANTTYTQCMAAANSCYTTAENQYQSCMDTAYYQFNSCMATSHQQEQSICNSMLWQDEQSCNAARDAAYNDCFQTGGEQVACEFNFQQDQQYCANNYDNCLFICSTQNP